MNRAMLFALAGAICIAGPAIADEAAPRFGLDLGLIAGLEPYHHREPDGSAFVYGGDARLRLGVLSIGARVEKTAGLSDALGGAVTDTRALGMLWFNIGLGERTVLSPALGFGSSVNSREGSEVDARAGFEIEHFVARSVSIGGGLSMDVRLHMSDGLVASVAGSAACRVAFHLR